MQDQNSIFWGRGCCEMADKGFTPIGSERALENYLARFPKRSPCSLSFLFSSAFLCPPALSEFHLLAYSSFSHPAPSYDTITLVSLLIYSPASTQQQFPLQAATTPFPHFIFPSAQAWRFHLSAAPRRLPQQGAALAFTSAASFR